MLSGPDCASVRHAITTAIQQQTGVLQVDQDLLPDHVLIDFTRPSLTEETVASTANAAIGGRRCRAEIMRSCITAEPLRHHANSSPSTDGSTQSH